MGNFFYKYKGTHILADFTGVSGDENEVGKIVFKIMKDAINLNTHMKIVHDKLCILNGDTPPGFTCGILLLDESHFSCSHFTNHCYTDESLLSCDIFTCGSSNTKVVMNYFLQELKKTFPKAKCTYMKTHKRFRY